MQFKLNFEICLQNLEKIQFPMERSLKLDSSLTIEKKSPFDDLNIQRPSENEGQSNLDIDELNENKDSNSRKAAKKSETSPNKNDQTEEILQLDFKWEKKSTGSTNSLLDSDSDVIEIKIIFLYLIK